MDGLKVFIKWYERSSVRSAPHRILDSNSQCRFFSPALAPILQHPYLEYLYQEQLRSIEVQLLYYYLRFTEYLETQLVNPVILSVINDDFPIDFSQRIKDEAYKIYCDEAYHALQSHDMISQIIDVAKEKPIDLQIVIRSRLEKLKMEIDPNLLSLFDLFFVCVAETLVSHELGSHTKDKTLHSAIRAIMQDHARDEASHALFFREIMFVLKDQLSKKDFQSFLNYIPKFLEAYLLPERQNLYAICAPYMSIESIEVILDELFQPDKVGQFIAEASGSLNRTIEELKIS